MATPSLDALPDALAGHAGYLLVRVGKHAQRLFSLAIAPDGLRPAHADILLTLAERGRQSQVQIAETLAIERAHLVALLDQLQVLGFAVRAADPDDRRRHSVQLTPAGEAVVVRLARLATEVEAALLAALDDAERATFRALLRRLARDAEEGDRP